MPAPKADVSASTTASSTTISRHANATTGREPSRKRPSASFEDANDSKWSEAWRRNGMDVQEKRPRRTRTVVSMAYLAVSVAATLAHVHVVRAEVPGGVARWHLVSNCMVLAILQMRGWWKVRDGRSSKPGKTMASRSMGPSVAWRCVLSQGIIQVRIYTDGLLYRSMPVVFSIAVRNLSAFLTALAIGKRTSWLRSGVGCIGCLLLACSHQEGLPVQLLLVQSTLHFSSALVGGGGLDWSKVDLEEYMKKTALWNLIISLPITWMTGPHQSLAYWPGWLLSVLGASSGIFFLLTCKHADMVRAMHIASLSKAASSLLAWDLHMDHSDALLTALGGLLTLGVAIT